MRHECYFCHVRTVENLIDKFKPDDNTAEDFVFAVNHLLGENRDLENPYLATLIHRLAKRMINHDDPYLDEKFQANEILLGQYGRWKSFVHSSADSLHAAAKLAVAGNIIDYGAHSAPRDIHQEISDIVERDFKIDESELLYSAIQDADSILYLGDNAGEIVFDRLFIEEMQHPNVTFVVRGKPVINDVTLEDAKQVEMEEVSKVISNGYDAPSTLPEYCSDEFYQTFTGADLIISKGQGNYEGLMNHHEHPVFFMLMAKCNPIARLLGVNKGDLVIKKMEKCPGN